MTRFLSLFFLCLAATVLLPGAARAQIFGGEAAKETTFGSGNPGLEATLKLQHQINMIKRLIERERAVSNMLDSAIALGISDPYVPPASYVICRQLPANILCAQQHPGLYENYSVDRIAPLLPVATVAPPSIPMNDASLPQDIAQMQTDAETLYWMDITCLREKCSAVVTPNPSDSNARYRITVGDTLPGGARVDGISAQGVTLKRGSQQIHVDPAPAA